MPYIVLGSHTVFCVCVHPIRVLSGHRFSGRRLQWETSRGIGRQAGLAESLCIMQVMYHPTAGHGGFLLSSSWRRQVLANIKVVVATGADLAAKSAKVQQ